MNYWSNTPKFAVSFLKAMYGDAARKENDWAFDYLPKVDRNYSWTQIWDNMYRGSVKGLFAFGMNGVMIGPDSQKNIDALKKADWLVVGEIYPDETSEFWKSPGTTPEEMKSIQTTVYRLPCAGFAEKDGSFTNSARWLQWKNAALPPPGDCRLDQAILAQIFLKVRDLYKKEGGKFPDPILNLTWAYSDPAQSVAGRSGEGDQRQGAGGRHRSDKLKQTIKAGQQLPSFAWLRDDGTTACGNWIYSGCWTEAGPQLPAARHGRSFRAWHLPQLGMELAGESPRALQPRLLRCGGQAVGPRPPQVWWNESAQKWVGHDVPDFKPDSNPKDHMGPFIMNPEGVGRLFVPIGAVADGPFPEHYEPIESPAANLLHPNQSNNPIVKKLNTPLDKYGTVAEGFNIVCTTYRLTEHYHYWTKNNPANVELVPEPFVEIPAELADEMGIKGGEKVKVTSARGEYLAKAFVTRRIKSMTIDGKKMYQIGIPDSLGLSRHCRGCGPNGRMPANLLSPAVVDPNAFTPEFKGFLVKLERA